MHRQTASPRARARSRILVSLVAAMLAAMTLAAGAVPVGAASAKSDKLGKIDHIVVIYEENHSFDNLYGGWEGVNGLANADVAHTTQVAQNGTPYACLKQNDANLTSPPLAADACSVANGDAFDSHFPNTYFSIDQYIPSTAVTCPPTLQAFSFPNGLLDPGINPATGLPVPGATAGGCTRDIVHRFYHEQYQLDGGRQDRYVTGSDAIGLTMGVYDSKALPIYKYLHANDHPKYAIADNFFQAAFGGSFLNHQWLIAAASPVDPNGDTTDAGQHPTLDANGMPSNEPLYTSTIAPPVPPDRPLTATCAQVATLPAPANKLACGNYGVNTMQPIFNPSGAFGALIPAQTNPTIGDRLTAKGVDWAWYSGGWSNADGDVGAPGWTNGTSAAATPTGAWIPTSIRAIAAASRPRPGRAARTTCSSTTTSRSTTTRTSRPPRRPAWPIVPRISRTRSNSRTWSARLRRRATSSRSASSSRSVRRTSTRATPASPTAATTSWTCCRPSRAASAPRTRWSS